MMSLILIISGLLNYPFLVASTRHDSPGCEPFSDSMLKLTSSLLTIEQPSIILSSPNYGPDRLYTANATCTRRIFAPKGYQLKLEFFNSTYDIETSLYTTCKYDMLEVRDGAYPYSPIMARFCSRTANADSMLSRSNAIYLKFLSDASIEGAGFQLRVTMLKISSQAISAVTNICRYQLTAEDGALNLKDSPFTKIALSHAEEGVASTSSEDDDYLVECNIDIEPVIDDAAYLLIRLDFKSTNQLSQQLSTACPLHRFEFHDLGIAVTGKQAQQLPLEPDSLQTVCTPSRDTIVVSKTSQATVRVILLSSFLSPKQHAFYAVIHYAVLAPPERCLVLTPSINVNETNITAIATTTMKKASPIASGYRSRMGTWCNGRNNCPTVASVSVDESNCLASAQDVGNDFENDASFFIWFNISSDQIVKAVLYGSVSFIGIVLCVGVGILAFRRFALAVIKAREKKMRAEKDDAEKTDSAGSNIIITHRLPKSKSCCGCCCEDGSRQKQSAGGQIIVTQYPGKKHQGSAIPPATAVRMTSAYRNKHSSPAFRCNFDRNVNNYNDNSNNNNIDNGNNRRFRKNDAVENKRKKQQSSNNNNSKPVKPINVAHLWRQQRSLNKNQHQQQSPLLFLGHVDDDGNVLKKNAARYHSSSHFREAPSAPPNYNETVDFLPDGDNIRVTTINGRFASKSSQNVGVSSWLTKQDDNMTDADVIITPNNVKDEEGQQNKLLLQEQEQQTSSLVPSGKMKPMLPVPPIVTTLRDVGRRGHPESLSLGELKRKNNDNNDAHPPTVDEEFQKILTIRASPPTPFKNEEPVNDDDNFDEEPVLVRLSDLAYQDLTRSFPPAVMPTPYTTISLITNKDNNHNTMTPANDNNAGQIMSMSDHQYCYFSYEQPSSFHQQHPTSSFLFQSLPKPIIDDDNHSQQQQNQNQAHFSNGEDSNDSLMMIPPSQIMQQVHFHFLDQNADLKCSSV